MYTYGTSLLPKPTQSIRMPVELDPSGFFVGTRRCIQVYAWPSSSVYTASWFPVSMPLRAVSVETDRVPHPASGKPKPARVGVNEVLPSAFTVDSIRDE